MACAKNCTVLNSRPSLRSKARVLVRCGGKSAVVPVSVALVRIEDPLCISVVAKSCDGGIKLGRCDDPIADRATPALGVFGLDPDHVSTHGCHL